MEKLKEIQMPKSRSKLNLLDAVGATPFKSQKGSSKKLDESFGLLSKKHEAAKNIFLILKKKTFSKSPLLAVKAISRMTAA